METLESNVKFQHQQIICSFTLKVGCLRYPRSKENKLYFVHPYNVRNNFSARKSSYSLENIDIVIYRHQILGINSGNLSLEVCWRWLELQFLTLYLGRLFNKTFVQLVQLERCFLLCCKKLFWAESDLSKTQRCSCIILVFDMLIPE